MPKIRCFLVLLRAPIIVIAFAASGKRRAPKNMIGCLRNRFSSAPHARILRYDAADGTMKKRFLILWLVAALAGQSRIGHAISHEPPPLPPQVLPRADDVKPAMLLAQFLKASLTVKAFVSDGDRDEETVPVDRTAFYLLDENFVNSLKSAGFQPEDPDTGEPQTSDHDILTAAAGAFLPAAAEPSREDAEDQAFVGALLAREISRHKVARFTTDERGAAQIKAIPIGEYYLFGIKRIADEVLVWHHPVVIKPGANQLQISRRSAAAAFKTED